MFPSRVSMSFFSMMSGASLIILFLLYAVSLAVATKAAVAALDGRLAFVPAAATRKLSTSHSFFKAKSTTTSCLFSETIVNGEGGGAKISDVMSRNQLMHAMLRVPNVNATVDYWLHRGANLHSYRKSQKAETAFVGFGKDGPEGGYFSLEITKNIDETFHLGNAVQYFGLSMLLGFDLKSAAAGVSSKSPFPILDKDPNGLEVRSVAAAPGDSFCRLCLRTSTTENILSKTADFYVKCLGMEQVASDESCVCVRYTSTKDENPDLERIGVATTLVFALDEEIQDLDPGNCFDHLAISTANVESAAMALRVNLSEEEVSKIIFMEPTAMFGTKIMGLHDPNGYKVYLVERQPPQTEEESFQ